MLENARSVHTLRNQAALNEVLPNIPHFILNELSCMSAEFYKDCFVNSCDAPFILLFHLQHFCDKRRYIQIREQ